MPSCYTICMKRFVFTFGTLYEPQIVIALLGTEPHSFLATLHGYAVYKGTGNDLSEEMRVDIGKKRDLAHFTISSQKNRRVEK